MTTVEAVATRDQARREFFIGLGALLTAIVLARVTPLGEALLGLGLVGPSLPLFLAALGVIVWMRVTGRPWRSLGLSGGPLGIMLLIALAALAARLLWGEAVGLVASPEEGGETPARFAGLAGDLGAFLIALVPMWVVAAFGEEVLHRGFLLPRLAIMMGRTTDLAWIVPVLILAVGFGLGHAYQGVTGLIGAAGAAVIYSVAYIASGFRVWPGIVAHGLANSIALYALASAG